MEIIVIGGNAAGPAAAAKAKRTNPEANVKLFESGKFISTGTCELPYVLSGIIKDYKKIVFFDESSFFEKKGVQVFTEHLVSSINTKVKKIFVDNLKDGSRQEYVYDKLILTTGSKARNLPIIPANSQNVFSLKSVTDYLKIKDFLSNNNVKNVAVFGSGYIGLEIVEALCELGLNVTLIEIANNPIPSAEPEISALVSDSLNKQNVEFIGNAESIKIFSEANAVNKIKINGELIDVDLILNTSGIVPNNVLSVNLNLEMGKFGGLRVDKKMRTSNPHIYAAGDNVETLNAITNRWDYFPIATLAQQQAHIAGENAAGGNAFFEPVVKNIAVKLFDNVFAEVGLTESAAKKTFFGTKSVSEVSTNLIKVMPNSRKTFGKIVYDSNSSRLIGASFLGGQEVIGFADMISMMIKNKIKATELSKINYNYTPPNSPFINLLSILGRKI